MKRGNLIKIVRDGQYYNKGEYGVIVSIENDVCFVSFKKASHKGL